MLKLGEINYFLKQNYIIQKAIYSWNYSVTSSSETFDTGQCPSPVEEEVGLIQDNIPALWM
jgi:hypothetical protein